MLFSNYGTRLSPLHGRGLKRNCRVILLIPVITLIFIHPAYAGRPCGELENRYGPFDYLDNDAYRERLPVVERVHFTDEVRTLRGGNTGSLAHDIDYTLRVFPNHHHALYTMIQYHLDPNQKEQTRYTMECYFDRAIRMNHKDGQVYALFGYYLHKKKKYKEALDRYQLAVELLKDPTEVHYNMALLYIDMKEYDLAKQSADYAYSHGYPLPGLKNKLTELGYYK